MRGRYLGTLIYMHKICIIVHMRTTVDLNEQKLAGAAKATGITQKTALLEAGLDALIAREAARRLAKMGGRVPKAWAPKRRRPA